MLTETQPRVAAAAKILAQHSMETAIQARFSDDLQKLITSLV